MKKQQSASKSKKKQMPNALKAALEKQRQLAAQQEAQGNFDSYDHMKLARLETAAKKYE